MEDKNKYSIRVIGFILFGLIFWLFFGILSRVGIFWFGIDFGFELIVRRVYAVLGLTILILSVILSIIMTIVYRQHFPKLNEQIVKGNNQYKELRSFKKIAFWVIMFGVLLQTIVFLLPFYILVITDNLVYDFELLVQQGIDESRFLDSLKIRSKILIKRADTLPNNIFRNNIKIPVGI